FHGPPTTGRRRLLHEIREPDCEPRRLLVSLRSRQACEPGKVEKPDGGRMEFPATTDPRLLHLLFDVLDDGGVDPRLHVTADEPAGDARRSREGSAAPRFWRSASGADHRREQFVADQGVQRLDQMPNRVAADASSAEQEIVPESDVARFEDEEELTKE